MPSHYSWILKFIIACYIFLLVGGLPPEWTKLISSLCAEFNDDHPTPPNVIRNPQCITTLKELVHTPLAFLLPPLILWSPLEQFHGIISGQICCPKCTDQNVRLHARAWRDGTHGERSEPRKIHGCDGVTLLVGRVYECDNKHEVLAYHPDIIKQIPGPFIPFKLWHITGFTVECIELVVALISGGMSVNYVKTVIEQKQLSFFYTQKRKFMHISASNHELTTSFPTAPAWQQHFSAPLPSNHALSSCFLAEFWSKESLYVQCMQNTTVDDNNLWLSLDHTFSSTSECECYI